MNPEQFKANINGVAKTNRYRVFIDTKSIGIDLPPYYQYLTKEVAFPGKEIRTTEMSYWGGNRMVAQTADYDPLTITFYSDSKLELRRAFVEWITKKIINMSTWTCGYYNDYTTTLYIEVLNQKNEIIDKIKVEEAYPKSLTETTLSWENNDMPFEFSVSFQYFDWVPESFQGENITVNNK